jgi:23S rRNA (uracil1939-C5)-methyltransferase
VHGGAASARSARTRYRRERVVGGHSLVSIAVAPVAPTVRRHLSAIGHPILGDARHGHAASNRHFAERHALDRPFLHCRRLALAHPATGRELVVECELAGDLAAVLARLEQSRQAPGFDGP